MNDRTLYALTGSLFAAIFLIAVIMYGGTVARPAACAAALLVAMAQYVANDASVSVRAYRASIFLAYFALVVAIGALWAMAGGH